jgi:low temperature requirement protein LtrA
VDGGHIAERCALFIIIALGESILVTGATLSTLVFAIIAAWERKARRPFFEPSLDRE